jgi:protein ImuA
MFSSSPPSLADLRQRIARIGGAPERPHAAISLGVAAVDAHLGGGLALGALHEVMGAGVDVAHGAAAALFAAGVLARTRGPVLWVCARADLFAPGLAAAGLSPDRVVHVQAGRAVLAAMEEGLRLGCPGVVGEVEGKLGLTASRRLHLAAEATGALAFVLRRARASDDPALTAPSAAATRWRIANLPSGPPVPHAPEVPGLGPPRWRLDLLRARGAEPSSWIVEAGHAPGDLRLVAGLDDGQATPQRRRA